MGMGCPVLGIIALVLSAAFLVWVSERAASPAQTFGKVLSWVSVILSLILIIGQLYMCSSMCMKGKCWRDMGGMHMMKDKGGMPMMKGMGGMGGGMNMPMPPPPAAETGK